VKDRSVEYFDKEYEVINLKDGTYLITRLVDKKEFIVPRESILEPTQEEKDIGIIHGVHYKIRRELSKQEGKDQYFQEFTNFMENMYFSAAFTPSPKVRLVGRLTGVI